jgi:hypothetical protein
MAVKRSGAETRDDGAARVPQTLRYTAGLIQLRVSGEHYTQDPHTFCQV